MDEDVNHVASFVASLAGRLESYKCSLEVIVAPFCLTGKWSGQSKPRGDKRLIV